MDFARARTYGDPCRDHHGGALGRGQRRQANAPRHGLAGGHGPGASVRARMESSSPSRSVAASRPRASTAALAFAPRGNGARETPRARVAPGALISPPFVCNSGDLLQAYGDKGLKRPITVCVLNQSGCMGCMSSKDPDDELKPSTRQNSFKFGSVNLVRMSLGERSSCTLKRQLSASGATTGPVTPGIGRSTSLGQTSPLDESTRKAKGSRQRAADARRSQNEALYTENSFKEFASMYGSRQAAPEAAAPEVVAPEVAAPAAGTLAWFTGADLVSHQVLVSSPPEEAAAASPGD